jgi:hypothetical protein
MVYCNGKPHIEPPDGYSIVLFDMAEPLFKTKKAAIQYIAEGVCGGVVGPPGKPEVLHEKCGQGTCEYRAWKVTVRLTQEEDSR